MVLQGAAQRAVRGESAGGRKKLEAWARWHAGAGPGVDGRRLWDFEARYGDSFTSAYCKDCPAACPDCPRPRLLPAAVPAAVAYGWCRTQWVHAPSGQPTGLRYADCIAMIEKRAAAANLEATVVADMLEGLEVIETAMLAVCRERLAKETPAHE